MARRIRYLLAVREEGAPELNMEVPAVSQTLKGLLSGAIPPFLIASNS